jgi:hypothetical protein
MTDSEKEAVAEALVKKLAPLAQRESRFLYPDPDWFYSLDAVLDTVRDILLAHKDTREANELIGRWDVAGRQAR